MEINSHKNTFEGGMDMDTDVSYAANNTYRYAQNIRLVTNTNGTNGVLQNIDYIKKYEKIDALKTQKILNAIAVQYPYHDETLQNTAILLTQDKYSNAINSIYLVSDFDKSQLSCRCVMKILWHITADMNISMIYNYETKSVYKLYVNDSSSGLKIINLADYKEEWGDKEPIQNPSYFDSNALATLIPLSLESFTSGNLKSGAYQYFYKLYNDTGIESALSAGSEIIYNYKYNIYNSAEAEGYSDDYSTSNGIVLRFIADNTQFDKIKIYRVFWKDNLNEPEISIILQDRISKGNLNYTITDALMQSLTTVTQEEFNDIIPYIFKAQIMTSFKNRLFFANIESSDWDIPKDWDTRSFRFNKNQQCLLQDSNGNGTTYSFSQIDSIPYDDDAINPMNVLDVYPSGEDNEYAFQQDGITYGGSGTNIDFEIVYGEIYESPHITESYTADGKLYDSYNGAANVTGSSISIKKLKTNVGVTSISLNGDQLLSYANPYIAAKFQSYQRDEVYRFGIVFYNKNNVTTPVHWICDIRFPSGDTDGCAAFANDITNVNSKYELIARPFGVKFTIKNFPDEAVAAEIVRCDRTYSDRTVVAQGMLNNTVHFRNVDFDNSDVNADISNGTNDIRSPYIPTMREYPQVSREHKITAVIFHGKDGWNVNRNLKTFASPEICTNYKSEVIDKSCYICPVYQLTSDFNSGSLRRFMTQDMSYYSEVSDVIAGLSTMGTINTEDKPILVIGSHNNTGIIGGVMKYFLHESANSLFKSNKGVSKTQQSNNFIADIGNTKTARTDLPNQNNNGIQAFKDGYIDSIDAGNYTNTIVASGSFGIAGVNQLINMKSADVNADHILYNAFSKTLSTDTDPKVVTLLCNIKKRATPYGGNSYLSRSSNNYISCGGYIKENEAATGKVIFGGDVYLTVFNYMHASMFSKNDWQEEATWYRRYLQVYLPVESTINCYARWDDYYLKHSTEPEAIEGETKNRWFMFTNPTTLNGITYSYQMYAYNSAYSVSDGGVNYSSGSTNENISTNETNYYRINCSEQKSFGEEIDSWSKAKFANTLDLDAKCGITTSLNVFNNNLYAFQQNAFNVLSVDDRSLISDQSGAQLVLGTGGVLSRFDTIVQNYGAGIVNDKSIISSSQSIYWYDTNKNVICSYGSNGFHILSKEKKVQTFLNSLAQTSKINLTSVFNDKTNELWLKAKGNSLIYNEQSDCFTSFYSHIPDWGLRFYDRLITIRGTNFYKNDSFGEEADVEDLIAKVTFTVNPNSEYTKVFDNQWLAGNIEDPNNSSPQVITSVKCHTKTQDSFEINYNNIECREDTYRFPIPRQDRGDLGSSDESEQDILNRSFSPRMRGKYMLCEYTFDCNDDKKIEIPLIKTTFRQSML